MKNLRSEQEIIKSWQGDVSRPIVSISCITYNHEKFIEDALEGFLIQETDYPFEILVHDDASLDRTADIIREYEAYYPNLIKPIYQTENQFSKRDGIAGKIHRGRAKGKYIAMCEGDDYWVDPCKLQKQVDVLERHSEFVMCFTNSSIIDGENNIINESRLEDDRRRNLSQVDIISGLVPPTNTILMINIFSTIDFMHFPNVVNGDLLYSALATEQGGAKYLDEITACYRIHKKGLWSSNSSEYRAVNYLKTYLVLLGRFKHKYEDILLRAINNGYAELLGYYKK